jgi:hypothetical protein
VFQTEEIRLYSIGNKCSSIVPNRSQLQAICVWGGLCLRGNCWGRKVLTVSGHGDKHREASE